MVVPRNLEPIYGNDIAIRALALLSNYPGDLHLTIAGGGPQRAELEDLARTLGVEDRVRFTGRLGPDQMAELLRGADLVLNPVRADNMPNSVLEALACGVPVVSTNVGGVPFLVQHGVSAWLVEPESPSALAEGIRCLLEDHRLRDLLAAEGRRLAQSCAWPVVREQWLELYRKSTRRD